MDNTRPSAWPASGSKARRRWNKASRVTGLSLDFWIFPFSQALARDLPVAKRPLESSQPRSGWLAANQTMCDPFSGLEKLLKSCQCQRIAPFAKQCHGRNGKNWEKGLANLWPRKIIGDKNN
jgi:hypothetical protein